MKYAVEVFVRHPSEETPTVKIESWDHDTYYDDLFSAEKRYQFLVDNNQYISVRIMEGSKTCKIYLAKNHIFTP